MKWMHGRSWIIVAVLPAFSVALLTLGMGLRSADAQEGSTVSIIDFAFQPASLEVAAGTAVTWTNTGQARHTATADNGAFDSGRLQPGESFSQTFATAGTFPYHCEIHPEMTGTIVVTGAAAAATPSAEQGEGQGTDQDGGRGGAQRADRLPATGAGSMAFSGPETGLALLVGILAVVLSAAAVVGYRRA